MGIIIPGLLSSVQGLSNVGLPAHGLDCPLRDAWFCCPRWGARDAHLSGPWNVVNDRSRASCLSLSSLPHPEDVGTNLSGRGPLGRRHEAGNRPRDLAPFPRDIPSALLAFVDHLHAGPVVLVGLGLRERSWRVGRHWIGLDRQPQAGGRWLDTNARSASGSKHLPKPCRRWLPLRRGRRRLRVPPRPLTAPGGHGCDREARWRAAAGGLFGLGFYY